MPALVRRAESDRGGTDDQGRASVALLRFLKSLFDLCVIVGVGTFDDAPAVSLESLADIFRECDFGGAFDADHIRIVEDDDVVELLVPGERGGFMCDAFHHAAVAGDDVDLVVKQSGAFEPAYSGGVFCGDSHADAGGESGSERSGRDFDARCVAEFRMSGGFASPLAELLDFIHGKSIAEKMKQTVNEHGTVSGGEHETVASEPVGIPGIVFHVVEPEVECEIRTAHGHAGVP